MFVLYSGFEIKRSTLASLRNNNSMGNDAAGPTAECDIRSDVAVAFTRQFFGIPEPVLPNTTYAGGSPAPTGSTTGRINRTRTNKASAL